MIQSVIIADDDNDDHLVFESALRDAAPGVKLYPVANGVELMSLLRHFVPDLIFLDLDMPYKNGLECMKEIRSLQATRDLPIIVFSSTNRLNNIDVAYEMGAHLFFIKPTTYNRLLESIRSILSLDWSAPEQIKQSLKTGDHYHSFTPA